MNLYESGLTAEAKVLRMLRADKSLGALAKRSNPSFSGRLANVLDPHFRGCFVFHLLAESFD